MLESKSIFRVIKTPKKSAKENMAIDDALLSSFKDGDLPILRVYTWEDSFTVGISQKFEDYDFINNFNGNYAKRITGGGVLFHGHDLSYSLIIPTHILKDFSIKLSYEKICTFILNFYKNLDLDCMYAKDNEAIKLSKNEYCQVGFEAYDILANCTKIGGNAQRRTKKAIFQHGSIPIKCTKIENLKSKIGSTLEDLNINISFEEATEKLIESFEKSFNVELKYSTLTNEENEKLKQLLKDKYDYAN